MVCEDIVGEALSALVVNKMRGVLDVVAIKAPGFGTRRKEMLQDIAIATGATYVAEEVSISTSWARRGARGSGEGGGGGGCGERRVPACALLSRSYPSCWTQNPNGPSYLRRNSRWA